jgi:hypothetical protein
MSPDRRLAPVHFLLVLLAAGAAIPAGRAQDTGASRLDAAVAAAPLDLTVEQAYGDTLRYDYGTTASGLHFHLDVVFRPDEVEWWELWEGGKQETDPTQSVLLDEHRLLASWPEDNGWFITLYADFRAGQTSFCGTDGERSQCATGTIAPRPDAAPSGSRE